MGCLSVFGIPLGGGGFFLSAWMLMLFWSLVAPRLELPTLSYVDAMTVTVALWLAVAPLIVAVQCGRRRNRSG